MRDAARHAHEVARARLSPCPCEIEGERALQHVDEFVLRRMHVRWDEGAGRIERLERATIVVRSFQPIAMTEDVQFAILRSDLGGSGWSDACGQRAHGPRLSFALLL